MITSLGIILLSGMIFAFIAEKIKLPRITGMLIAGIFIGPYCLNLIDASVLDVSSEIRKIALIIILLKAGLSLDINDLKKVGRPAILMSFLPATIEIIGYVIVAPVLLGMNHIEAAILGSVMAAVSPAVVVPRMVKLMDEGYGTDKSISQLIMAGASCDDIFVIVLFTAFLSMGKGGSANVMSFINIPISIFLGVLIGCIVGYLLYIFFQHFSMNTTTQTIIVLAISFLLVTLENVLENYVSISSLLAIVSMGCVIKKKCDIQVSSGLASQFGKIWIPAETLLFVLVGVAVNISYMFETGISAVIVILLALCFRSVGVFICLLKTPLNKQERMFCIFSYLPKATVQASIGSVPLANGLACGSIVLSVAVIGIILTATLGAFLIDGTYRILLKPIANDPLT